MAKDNHSEQQAKAQLESIKEMVAALDAAKTDNEREDAERTIHEDPLSVEVRTDWHSPGEKGEISEYCILLATGGPACRIVGTLGRWNEPDSARIEHQDWGTPWGVRALAGGPHAGYVKPKLKPRGVYGLRSNRPLYVKLGYQLRT